MARFAAHLVLVTLVASVVGCRMPIPDAPKIPMQDAWSASGPESTVTESAMRLDEENPWWLAFDDDALVALIDRVEDQNLDLRAAFARVQSARALYQVNRGERVPDVDGTGLGTRRRLSEEVNPFLIPGINRTDTTYSMGLEAGWELDLWGRVTRSINAAQADLQANVEAFRDLWVVLTADIASNYVELRTLQERLRIAQKNVASQTKTRQLTRDRLSAELAPELDVQQAELNLATTEATIPALEIAIARVRHRLAVLVGVTPGTLILDDGPLVELPTLQPALGLPYELLKRRPDLRQAERELMAQAERIGVARADRFPRVTILGSFGFDAINFNRLSRPDAQAWSWGPSIRWNLFDGGRVTGRIREQQARFAELKARYQGAVLVAVEEVENAIVGRRETQVRRAALRRASAAAGRSVELVQALYRSGLTDFQNVLDAERSLLASEDALAIGEGDVVQEWIRLCRALGGGWQSVFPEVEASATRSAADAQ